MAIFEIGHIPDTFSLYYIWQIDEKHLSLHYLPPHKTKRPLHCAEAFCLSFFMCLYGGPEDRAPRHTWAAAQTAPLSAPEPVPLHIYRRIRNQLPAP